MNNFKTLSHKSKKALVIVSVILVLAVVSGLAAAYLHEKTGEITNTFIPAYVACEVEEKFSNGKIKSSVQVENTGTTDAYIRLALVGNIVSNNVVTGNFDPGISLNSESWQLLDNYYYCKVTIAPGKLTDNLLSSAIKLTDGQRIDICAEAVQATDDAIANAWGVVFNTAADGTITVEKSGN